jgi:hypothetical protein
MKKLILSLSVLLLWMGAHYTCAGQLHNSVIVIIRQKLLPPKGKWPEDVFGWFVRLEYDRNGNLNIKVQDEDLMAGDAANPPP